MSESISSNPKKPSVAAPSDLDTICVAGITPFTTIDFPGRLAGVFYLQGCPWRCRYCYNSEFWPMPPEGSQVPKEKILQYLESRRGHLDGIVFSGGEPTAHELLPVWIKAVKAFGYEIGLHTAGMYPLCDWVGMDIKAPFNRYERVTQEKAGGDLARESAELLIASGKPYEFRTTVHPDVLSEDDIQELAGEIADMGCRHYALQAFRPEHCPDKALRESGNRLSGISAGLRLNLQSLFSFFQVRE